MRYGLEVHIEPRPHLTCLTVRVEHSLLTEFRYYAKEQRIPISELIRGMVKAWVDEQKRNGKPKQGKLFE